MAQVIKRENITVITREYTDNQGNQKKVYKTIGELTTFQGDDGSTYQKGELFYPHANFNLYPQEDRNQQQPQQPQQPQYQQAPQGYQQPQQVPYGQQRGGNPAPKPQGR